MFIDVEPGISMPKFILIVSVSAKGSTPEIAQVIGDELQKSEYSVKVIDVKDIDSLEGCTAIVLGIPLYTVFSGKDAFSMFKQQFGEELAKIPVAVFSAGLFYEGLKHEKEDYVMTTLKKILFPINPVTTTLFVGTLEGENLHLKDRDENRNINSIANFQNLDKIREWAHALPSLLDLQQRDFPARIAGKHKVGI
jgi:menaquinone-dependent protoporphyrinogen IX oxidase